MTTDLQRAAQDGYIARVRELLADCRDLNARDENGDTPLHAAAAGGHVEVVKLLLAAGADVNVTNEYGETPLHWVPVSRRAEIAELLLQAGARLDLHSAVAVGDLEAMGELLRSTDPDIRTRRGDTPLHVAAFHGDVNAVRVLLDHGAGLNSRNAHRLTPLYQAVRWGHLEVAQALLDRGADPNTHDDRGETPLHCAGASDAPLTRLLLECGADPNARDDRGTTPLQVALHDGRTEAATALLESGAMHDLFTAAAVGDAAALERLVGEGGDIDAREGITRATPLAWAARNGQTEAVALLVSRGADVEAPGMHGETPMQVAAYGGHQEIVRLLRDGREVDGKAT
jgi:ankyrin repeat protein